MDGSIKTREELKKQKGKSNKTWYFSVRYTDTFGNKKRYHSKNYLTQAEAKHEEIIFLSSVSSGNPTITFKVLYQNYLKQKKNEIKESTFYCKTHKVDTHLIKYFGDTMIKDITMNSIIEWKDKMNKISFKRKDSDKGKKYSLVYKQGLFIELQAILEFGRNFYGLKENVAKKVGNFKDKNDEVISNEEKIRYIKPNEYKLFESVIDDSLWKTFFAFLYYTGCRKGEVQALTWEDINFKNETVRIIKTLTYKTIGKGVKITNTKNRKNRTISLPNPLMELLKSHYEYENKIEDFNNKLYVFGNVHHVASITIDRKRKYYYDLVDKEYPNQKFNRITNHEFRHSHASLLISKGISADEIAHRLGDTVEVIREVYAHLFPETQDKIKDLLNNL